MAVAAATNEPSSSCAWLLPFDAADAGCCSIFSSTGRCTQGNGTSDSHKGELRFAFDFDLPVGTPVLASAAGQVAASCSSSDCGGRSAKMRTKANFVVLRHAPGVYSRYYHLCKDGVHVSLGQHVAAGELIGRSGNTGYSGSPHLHWDVVDVLATDTATLALAPAAGPPADGPPADGTPGVTPAPRALLCAAGSFCSTLPPCGATVAGRVVWADPPTASEPTLRNAAEVAGAVVLLRRCTEVDFFDKARRAEAAGAIGAVIVNAEAEGATLITMAAPKRLPPTERVVGIPALMVSYASGQVIDEAVSAARGGGQPPPLLAIGRSVHFRPRSGEDMPSPDAGCDVAEARKGPPQRQRGSEGPPYADFVPLTMPARFAWPGRPGGYLPRTGKMPPRAVRAASLGRLPLLVRA